MESVSFTQEELTQAADNLCASALGNLKNNLETLAFGIGALANQDPRLARLVLERIKPGFDALQQNHEDMTEFVDAAIRKRENQH